MSFDYNNKPEDWSDFEFEIAKALRGISWQLKVLNDNLGEFNELRDNTLDWDKIQKKAKDRSHDTKNPNSLGSLLDKIKRNRGLDDDSQE